MESAMQQGKLRYIIIPSLIMFIGSFSQYQLPPISKDIMSTYGISMVQYVNVFTAPMIPAILFSLVVGIIADVYGFKKILTASLLISSFGMIMRVFADGFLSLYASTLLSGFGHALTYPVINKIIISSYGKDKVKGLMGIPMTFSYLGMTVSLLVTPYFSTLRGLFVFPMVLYLLITVMWILLIKDDSTHENINKNIIGELVAVGSNKKLWIIGIALMLTLGVSTSVTGFLSKYLIENKMMDVYFASVMTSVVSIGITISMFLSGIIVNKMKNFKKYLFVINVATMLLFIFVFVCNDDIVLFPILLLVGFSMGSPIPIYMLFPLYIKENKSSYIGMNNGLLSTLQLLGAVAIPSYIITPLSHNNSFNVMVIAFMGVLILIAVSLLLPNNE